MTTIGAAPGRSSPSSRARPSSGVAGIRLKAAAVVAHLWQTRVEPIVAIGIGGAHARCRVQVVVEIEREIGVAAIRIDEAHAAPDGGRALRFSDASAGLRWAHGRADIDAQVGARLNLEVDIIAKYVERLLAR